MSILRQLLTGARAFPLGRKVALVTLLVGGVALLVTTAGHFSHQITFFRQAREHELQVIADLVASNTIGPLSFHDTDAAREILQTLQSVPAITDAVLLDRKGTVLASYGAPQSTERIDILYPEGIRQIDKYTIAIKTIRFQDEVLGSLRIRMSDDEIHDWIGLQATEAGFVLAIGFIIAGLLALRLGRFISTPLVELTDAVRAVSERKDYSLRVEVPALDEVGQLTRGFNQMLEGIETRDRELSVHRQHLEALVSGRTAELRIERDRAEAASLAKSQFLANVSHELRTPLNAVIGMSTLLSDTTLEQEQRECVEAIISSGESLLALISDLLDLSKIEADRLTLELLPVDLEIVTQSATESVAHIAANKGISLSVELDQSLNRGVISDPTRLKQVLMNLLSNAVKFTEKGSVVVKIAVLDRSDERQKLRFEVRDTGIGIPAESLHSIFEAFSQVDASTTRQFGGTGLGLAISRRIVSTMGGTLAVESELGVGSRFYFDLSLPITSLSHRAQEIRSSLTSVQQLKAVAAEERKYRVLVVEDNPVNQRVTEKLLKKCGIAAHIVADGQAAIDALTSSNYDLVFMDCQMPRMDGYEATSRIRLSEGSARRTPIVAMTAHAMTGIRERCIEAGMDDYLGKPINIEELRQVLERYLFKEGSQ